MGEKHPPWNQFDKALSKYYGSTKTDYDLKILNKATNNDGDCRETVSTYSPFEDEDDFK